MPKRNLWFAWVVANTICWAIAFVALTSLDTVVHWSTGTFLIQFVASAAMGTIVGAGQWVILRQLVTKSSNWVLASALGFGIGLPLSNWVATGHDVITGQFLAPLVLGSVFGLAQWLSVQRQMRGLMLWMSASVLGWSAALGITMILIFSRRLIDLRWLFGIGPVGFAIADGLANGFVGGAVYGLITGALLVWLIADMHRTGELSTIPTT